MKKVLVALLLLFVTLGTNAQRQKLENAFETNGSLNDRFIYLEKTSTNYKEYKVITKSKFLELQQNVNDSIRFHKNLQNKKDAEINTHISEIEALQSKVKSLNEKLNDVTNDKNSISVFGISMYKTNYNLIAGIIIVLLLAIALFYLYKFNNSNVVTKEAKKTLEETQNEFEAFQKSSLIRQQELSRKLQDEIIKNRKD
ncbi:tRNA (guanine-N1)-methyltransferase [Flavicella marina]|uniref:tRNA (guanine-N1)-methyltransferase n=1 Tax=Flavicella marina TaxID=1475951 RepID=UPI00126457DE|nr:tRNA (guanine-N1)-methyltransferase [Flavicella marina]